MENQDNIKIFLDGSFWRRRNGWEDYRIDFFKRTSELMEEAHAISEDNEWLDLERYDNLIFAHLEKLQTAAEKQGSEDDHWEYCRNTNDLLMERLEYLDNLAIEIWLSSDPSDRYTETDLESSAAMADFNKSLIVRTKATILKLFDHYAKASELMLAFSAKRLETIKAGLLSANTVDGETPSVTSRDNSCDGNVLPGNIS